MGSGSGLELPIGGLNWRLRALKVGSFGAFQWRMRRSNDGVIGARRDDPVLQGAITDTGGKTFKVEVSGKAGAFGEHHVGLSWRVIPELALVDVNVPRSGFAAGAKPLGELQDRGLSLTNAGGLDEPGYSQAVCYVSGLVGPKSMKGPKFHLLLLVRSEVRESVDLWS